MKTSQRQTSLFIEETLTSSQEDSLVSHTAQQGSDLERKMTATSGQRCLEQFERFSHVGLWAKMFSALLIGTGGWYSTRCKLTWSLKGTKYSRLYFRLRVSTLPTDGIGFGLLPTPNTMDTLPPKEGEAMERQVQGARKGRTGPSNLREYVNPKSWEAYGMLPTPIAGDWKGQRRKDGTASMLSGKASLGLLPTPIADDNPTKNTGKRKQDGLQKRAFQMTGKTSQLNPRFVGEMMGFPPNWTELPFLNGETNQSKHLETPSSPR